jgi:pyruvate kinase
LRLRPGDTLIVTRDLTPGEPALFDAAGHCVRPARIGCTLPEVFAAARPGERILFDDGAIAGVVRAVHENELRVEINQTPVRGARLRGDKGINLPDSRLVLGALTEKDLRDLRFVAKHADMVGLSFVGSSRDVFAMQAQLARQKSDQLGLVLKIETRRAFERLPSLLLAAMRSPVAGVMIARGDLAVECGYERLAELQEEILWISEAAHVPVIWATQVLESLAKEGRPSRAEITDAAMSERAECVMLNKGPYIVEAVHTLDDILRRMQGHQHKKRPMLRKLRLAVGLRGL